MYNDKRAGVGTHFLCYSKDGTPEQTKWFPRRRVGTRKPETEMVPRRRVGTRKPETEMVPTPARGNQKKFPRRRGNQKNDWRTY